MLEAMTHFNLDAFTHLFSADEVVGPLQPAPACRSPMCWSAKTATWVALHMSSPPKFWEGLATRHGAARTFFKTRALPPARRALATKRRMIAGAGSAIFKTRNRALEWCEPLGWAEDVPHAPMYNIARGARRPAGQAPAAVCRSPIARCPAPPSRRCARPCPTTVSARWRSRRRRLLGQHNAQTLTKGWPARSTKDFT